MPTLCQSEAGWEHFPHDADVGVRGRGPTAAKEIAFGDHSDQMTVLVDHRQSADPPLQHGPNGLEYCGIRLDRHDRRGPLRPARKASRSSMSYSKCPAAKSAARKCTG